MQSASLSLSELALYFVGVGDLRPTWVHEPVQLNRTDCRVKLANLPYLSVDLLSALTLALASLLRDSLLGG